MIIRKVVDDGMILHPRDFDPCERILVSKSQRSTEPVELF